MSRVYLFIKEKIDYLLGGAMGFSTGSIKTELFKYIDHLFEEDSLFRLADACMTTVLTTVIGAVLLHLIHKYLFKSKKA